MRKQNGESWEKTASWVAYIWIHKRPLCFNIPLPPPKPGRTKHWSISQDRANSKEGIMVYLQSNLPQALVLRGRPSCSLKEGSDARWLRFSLLVEDLLLNFVTRYGHNPSAKKKKKKKKLWIQTQKVKSDHKNYFKIVSLGYRRCKCKREQNKREKAHTLTKQNNLPRACVLRGRHS